MTRSGKPGDAVLMLPSLPRAGPASQRNLTSRNVRMLSLCREQNEHSQTHSSERQSTFHHLQKVLVMGRDQTDYQVLSQGRA